MDPLADSPFSLLDLHSGLHLVTDAVHVDDALCLVLTCCVLRDVLWERFPFKWAQAKGCVWKQWLGDRSRGKDGYAATRIHTRDSAVIMTVGRLVWARSLDQPWPGPRPGWPSGWTDFLVHSAALHGAQESLQWALANGCVSGAFGCCAAAEGGHLTVLQWLRANGCA
jgi:hypothetical protein